ncbi:MAG TPA: hypothetical protein VFA43_00905 [Gemmatimonadaceae bacterium]|nr:hypothetical protein [Gemmatimonadaceae bacterium]
MFVSGGGVICDVVSVVLGGVAGCVLGAGVVLGVVVGLIWPALVSVVVGGEPFGLFAFSLFPPQAAARKRAITASGVNFMISVSLYYMVEAATAAFEYPVLWRKTRTFTL